MAEAVIRSNNRPEFRATEFGGLHGRQLWEGYRRWRYRGGNNSDTGIPLTLAMIAVVLLALWLEVI